MSWETRLVVVVGHFCGCARFRVHIHGTLFQALLRHGYVTSEHNAAECIEVIFFCCKIG